jgi:hypothetical protein
VDEAIGNQRVLSIGDHSAYSSGDFSPDTDHDPDVLLELMGPSAFSMVHAEAVNRSAKILFESPPGGASLRKLNDVVAEIQKKRDALFQKYKTTSIETRLIRRAETEAVDAILIERVQALHGAMRVTPAWTSQSEAFVSKAAQSLFRARAVDPVRIPKADAMNRAVAAYAKRAAAIPEVARLLRGVTEIRLNVVSDTPYLPLPLPLTQSSASKQKKPIVSFHAMIKRNRMQAEETETENILGSASAILIEDSQASSSSKTSASPKGTQLPAVEATTAAVSKAATSDASRKFLRDILADTSKDTDLLIRSYLLGHCIPYLYRIASKARSSSSGTGIDREILRAGTVGRLHIASVADSLKYTVEISTTSSIQHAKVLLYACVLLVSQHTLLTRMIAAEMIDALRTRLEFNRTDEASIKLEEERMSRLRSQQQQQQLF